MSDGPCLSLQDTPPLQDNREYIPLSETPTIDLTTFMSAYRIEVETTNATHNTTRTLDDQYLDCDHGMITIVTNDPSMIMRKFRVIRLEKIGPGYVLNGKAEDDAA